ncbi:DNA gyrase subunit A [Solibaculum mannosilyticum]|uniref:DNA gyrase subunit A n=1 Tax=Solibaculum mannosilyticum TaxID=2780922 RepID=UPI0034A7E656
MNKVIQVDIEKEMRKSYLDYSMSVIVSRALPDVRDGLKPVHRRILYTMHENSLWPDRAYRKCADTVGAVLGRYHPHGDASVYDALVRMAQDFSMRYILVDGHGNFGSVDGDPPAAYRYTEARMSKIATEMLTDIEKDTVDFTSNYDDRLKEPQVLPSRFPNLLVNGSTGIAVGMATNMPPHNLGEVIDAICLLIENPDATLNELMEYIQGPDFPTGGIIMGRSGIRAAYGTGRGRILVRAKADIVESHNGRFQIVVTELPYQVNKARLVQSIAELIKEKRIDGLQNVDDHSDREGMRIVMDLKREANPQVVLNQLFTYTQMQVTFGVINLALANGQPKVLTLKELLEHYIQFQLEVITRRTQFDLRKAQERAHILEALCKALDFIDEVVSILRSSKSIPEGKQNLMDRFEFDEIQATAIVQMTLGRLTGLEREKLEGELEELEIKIADFKDILASEERRLNIVREEVCALRDKYNNPRRTHITAISGEVDIEDLIEEEECVLTLTRFGYIKRLPVDTYRTQRRGGRGISGMTQREEDYVDEMFVCSTHDTVMFFTNIGRVYRLKGYEVPEGSRTSKGLNMANLLPLSQGERVNAMIRVTGDDKGYIVMVTRQGIIKRCDLSLFGNVRKNGIIALELNEGDELAWVRLTSGENRLIVATKGGMAIRFDENDVRPMGRAARGVKAIHLAEGDEVVGMARTREGGTLLTVTETGYGRRSQISDYRLQTRGGKGIINYRTSLYGKVAGIKVVDEDDDVMMIASNGIIIRVAVSDISIYARPAKGVRVMRIDPDSGDRLVTLARTPHEDDEETQPVEDEPQEASDLEEEAESADSVQEDETAGESQEP